MSEASAKNHANFADAFILTARVIKIDKRLPCFFDIKSDRLRAPRLPAGCRLYLFNAMCDTRSARPVLQGLKPEHAADPLLFSFDFINKCSGIDNLDAVVVFEVAKVRIT